MVLDFWDDEVAQFFRRALFALGEDWDMDDLLPLALEVGERNLACMALLDRANTHAFGTPEPTPGVYGGGARGLSSWSPATICWT